MEKLEKLVTDYDCTEYDALPKFIKRRCDALKKLQLEHIQIQHQYHKELQEIELKYEKLYKPLYEKRANIISGDYEPTDEECQLPANIQDSCNGDQENVNGDIKPVISEQEEESLKGEVKGLPGFWLGCLASTYNFNDSIEAHDRPVLKYLRDIKMEYGQKDDNLTYHLDFLFAENPYFKNSVLRKTYYLRLKPDEKDPFSYEGFEVIKSEGCDIDWLPGKDVTTKTVTFKQQNKNDGRVREKRKEVERDSFFYFFKPPKEPEREEGKAEEEIDEELAAIMAVDFELGEVIRQSIIPKACLYYTGYMVDEENDDDDESEDSDALLSTDDSDDDDDDDDVDDDDDESSDSLNNHNDKKKMLKGSKSPRKS